MESDNNSLLEEEVQKEKNTQWQNLSKTKRILLSIIGSTMVTYATSKCIYDICTDPQLRETLCKIPEYVSKSMF